jgi:hypothetical protein
MTLKKVFILSNSTHPPQIPSSAASSSVEAEERRLRMKKYSVLLSRPGLRKQFERFARYGEPRASGDYITLSQTEKWFKQGRRLCARFAKIVERCKSKCKSKLCKLRCTLIFEKY